MISVSEPIRQAFTPMKYQAWHRMIHPYFTKQPSNVVGEYIRHFCPPGGLVVDPFCGTGVTNIEALMNGRRTIGIDLEPLACFIAEETCVHPFDLVAFDTALLELHSRMKDICQYVDRADNSEIERHVIDEWYPRNVNLPLNSDRTYVEELFSKRNLIKLAHLRKHILGIQNKQARNLLLLAFSATLARASLMYLQTKSETSSGANAGLFVVYRYWLPNLPTNRDAWQVFLVRARLVRNAKIKGDPLLAYGANNGFTSSIYCDSAENLLQHVEPGSVDYIYTDPPYGAHIAYVDLCTMYHAWLGFDVTEANREHEAIEGGERGFDRQHYEGILAKSFEAMYKSLKPDGWLSLVYHHKDQRLWYAIRDMMKNAGFEYSNVVAQPLTKQTFHKVKRPLRVLGESLIVNFKKTSKRVFQNPIALPVTNLIKNVAERVIYRKGGATTEEILREVVADLFDNDMFFDASSHSLNDIINILDSAFYQDEEQLWQIRPGRVVGNFIPKRLRLQYYVVGYLRKEGRTGFDRLVTEVLPKLINGHQYSEDELSDVLNEIAFSNDGRNWELADLSQLKKQISLPIQLEEPAGSEGMPSGTVHNQHIYRLAALCGKLDLIPYIAPNEKRDPMLGVLKTLSTPNLTANESDIARIRQIDIIWNSTDGTPVWAFEIEESTTVLSAFERFNSLLIACPQLGDERRLTIVIPKSRHKKLMQELTESSYVGHPRYLENKISFIYSDELTNFYKRSGKLHQLTINDLTSLCRVPPAGK